MTQRLALAGIALLALGAALLDWLTLPPLPSYAGVRAAYRPSEAWLYDRQGRLIDSARVDFDRRRLAWTPLADIAPAAAAMVVQAEDHRFRSHGGADWLAIAGSLAAKRYTPATSGSFPTTGGLWVGLLVGIILILGGLTFLPSLALGPVADHLAVLGGQLS